MKNSPKKFTRQRQITRQSVKARAGELTERDLEVMRLIYEGLANKVIANRLRIALRMVEAARSRVFQKMGAKTAVDLVRMLALVDFYDELPE